MAGLLTQIGVIINPMAEYLNISITDAASLFSYLTGGTLIGTFVSMIVYSRFQIQQILKVNYAVFSLVMLALIFLDVRTVGVVSIYLILLGICCGTGLSGGAVIISKIFEENQRASAFIATDCAFSAAGFIFPTAATMILAANMEWTNGYGVVGILALILFGSAFVLKFPTSDIDSSTGKNEAKNAEDTLGSFKEILTPRVILMGMALCFYLVSQNTFLTWAPSYLQETFALTAEESGAAVGNYWGPSIFGLIAAAILVNKIPARLMLVTVVVLAIGITFFLSGTDDPDIFLTATLAFGFLTSSVYKLAISVGSQQIKNAPAVLVTFLLTCGTVGSTLAPALSAKIVELFGVSSAMLMTAIGFSAVFISILACLALERTTKTNNEEEAII